MHLVTSSSQPATPSPRKRFAVARIKAVPLAAIIVLHALVILAACLGMGYRIMPKAPSEPVFVQIVATPPQAIKPASTPVPPKAMRIDTPPPLTPPPLPVLNVAPKQDAVTPPPAAVAAPAETPAPVAAAPAPAPAPAKPAGPRLVTSGIELIRAPEPTYPSMSKGMGEHGRVTLRILINEKGLPARVQVESSSGFPRLDAAAREAALRYLFKPYLEDGQAIAIFTLLPISFELNT